MLGDGAGRRTDPHPHWKEQHERLRRHKPTNKAIVATVHEVARTVHFMPKHRVQYPDVGAQTYETQHRERQLAYLKRNQAQLSTWSRNPVPSFLL